MNSVPKNTSDRLRIIVLGYIVRGPLGGMAWHHLQYVMGLDRLGHDVYFVEDSGDSSYCCYDPVRTVTDTDPTYGLQFARRTFERVGLHDHWAYYDAHTSHWYGPCAYNIIDICATADLLLNLSGVNPLRPWLIEVPVRAFVDTDPVFSQIRHLTDPESKNLALQHNVFFSFAENFRLAESSIPDDGLRWQATRQPIVMDAWPVTPGPPKGRFTTVMQWDSYPALEFNGRYYGMKSASFEPYIDLPEKISPIFELAIGSPSAPRDLLRKKGWKVSDPLEIARDPWMYQHYIQQSKAECSVAKHGYVVSHSGWFSERSAAYLASGRPVLVQETGFSKWLEAGSGVIPFNTLNEAIAGVEEINANYDIHCQAARSIAETYFDAQKVLHHLIENALKPNCAQDTKSEVGSLLKLGGRP